MIITYLRSSSYNTYDFCPMQYFISYGLGIEDKVGKSAKKGTIVHKILEILANVKLAKQQSKKYFIDEEFGRFSTELSDLKIPTLIDLVIDLVYKKYTRAFSEEAWKPIDYRHCDKWVREVIDSKFNPLNRNIYAVEFPFDFELPYDWAKYKFGDLEGKLAIKGTIDLITVLSDGTFEVIDWKTGIRKDWATDEVKDYDKLQKDPQLHIYHFALSKTIPKFKDSIITIYFIKDGGPFSLLYDDDFDIKFTENLLRSRFEEIKYNINPETNKTWKCRRLCTFGKKDFAEAGENHVDNMVEFRHNKISSCGEPMKICDQIHMDLHKMGMDRTIKKYTKPGFEIGYYQSPGEIK